MQTFVLQMHGLDNVCTAKTGTYILEHDFFLFFFSIFSPQILPNKNNKTKVDVDELLEELFHESLTPTPLEIDDFYGPEVRVTNEDLCLVESFPCY